MKRWVVLSLGACVLLAGCGGESHQDLRTWMADQGKGARGRVDPLPQIAALSGRNRKIGLLATRGTVDGGRYTDLVHALDALQRARWGDGDGVKARTLLRDAFRRGPRWKQPAKPLVDAPLPPYRSGTQRGRNPSSRRSA